MYYDWSKRLVELNPDSFTSNTYSKEINEQQINTLDYYISIFNMIKRIVEFIKKNFSEKWNILKENYSTEERLLFISNILLAQKKLSGSDVVEIHIENEKLELEILSPIWLLNILKHMNELKLCEF